MTGGSLVQGPGALPDAQALAERVHVSGAAAGCRRQHLQGDAIVRRRDLQPLVQRALQPAAGTPPMSHEAKQLHCPGCQNLEQHTEGHGRGIEVGGTVRGRCVASGKDVEGSAKQAWRGSVHRYTSLPRSIGQCWMQLPQFWAQPHLRARAQVASSQVAHMGRMRSALPASTPNSAASALLAPATRSDACRMATEDSCEGPPQMPLLAAAAHACFQHVELAECKAPASIQC